MKNLHSIPQASLIPHYVILWNELDILFQERYSYTSSYKQGLSEDKPGGEESY